MPDESVLLINSTKWYKYSYLSYGQWFKSRKSPVILSMLSRRNTGALSPALLFLTGAWKVRKNTIAACHIHKKRYGVLFYFLVFFTQLKIFLSRQIKFLVLHFLLPIGCQFSPWRLRCCWQPDWELQLMTDAAPVFKKFTWVNFFFKT